MNEEARGNERARFRAYAWAVLAYNVVVVLWGAFVRATSSGAGCGAHWPLCNGEVIPRAPDTAMVIELSHRISSGIALAAVVGLVVLARRALPPGDPARRTAAWSLGFILAEALIGAGLVLFELVAHDASMKRALSMSFHLLNTFFLLAALTLTAWYAGGRPRIALRGAHVPKAVAPVLGVAALGMLLLGTSGAVTALGDTLFPATTFAEGVARELSPGAHVLVRLRLLHPVIAVSVGVLVIGAASVVRALVPTPRVRRFSRILAALFVAQIVAGLLNVALLAPVPMQLVHLFLADAVWIHVVLLAAAALGVAEPDQPIISRNGPAPTSDVPPSTSSVAPVT